MNNNNNNNNDNSNAIFLPTSTEPVGLKTVNLGQYGTLKSQQLFIYFLLGKSVLKVASLDGYGDTLENILRFQRV